MVRGTYWDGQLVALDHGLRACSMPSVGKGHQLGLCCHPSGSQCLCSRGKPMVSLLSVLAMVNKTSTLASTPALTLVSVWCS